MLKTNFWNTLFNEAKTRVWSVQLVPQARFFFSSNESTEALPGKDDRNHHINILKSQMTPKQIINYLNQYIIGQDEAKKAVAMALSIYSSCFPQVVDNCSILLGNRWRRRCLDEELKKEVYPKNILMVGPTGCGKTEVLLALERVMSILDLIDCKKNCKDDQRAFY